MFEVKSQHSDYDYTVLDENINKNKFTWKRYNTTTYVNDHNMLELKLNLTDVSLSGAQNAVEQMAVNLNRLHIKSNAKLISYDTFHNCYRDDDCKESTSLLSNSEIFNMIVRYKYENYED